MSAKPIEIYDEAFKLASGLSDNLYYVSDFTDETLRVFLDSLPEITHVGVVRNYNGDTLLGGVVQIFMEKKSVAFTFTGNNDWIVSIYFMKIRQVPMRINDEILVNFKS